MNNHEVRLTTTADIVVVYDVDGIITGWSEVAAKLLGYSAPEISGQPIAQIIPAPLRSDHQALIRRLIDSAQITAIETRRLARDGSDWPVRLTICPIKDAAGRVVALCEAGSRSSSSIADAGPLAELGITATALHREIVDSMFAFVGVLSADSVVLEVNQAALDAGGLLLADVVGRPLWDTYWWSYSGEAQEQIRAVMRSALNGNAVRREMTARMRGGHL